MVKITDTDRFGNKIDIDKMIRKFKKAVDAAGIIDDCHKKDYFMPKSLRRKEKSKKHQALLRQIEKKRSKHR